MNLEGTSYSTGGEAEKEWEQAMQHKATRDEWKKNDEQEARQEKFNSIQVGYTVGYKNTPETPVEFLTVLERDESSLTITIATSKDGESIPNVTMEQIVDVSK